MMDHLARSIAMLAQERATLALRALYGDAINQRWDIRDQLEERFGDFHEVVEQFLEDHIAEIRRRSRRLPYT